MKTLIDKIFENYVNYEKFSDVSSVFKQNPAGNLSRQQYINILKKRFIPLDKLEALVYDTCLDVLDFHKLTLYIDLWASTSSDQFYLDIVIDDNKENMLSYKCVFDKKRNLIFSDRSSKNIIDAKKFNKK